MVAVEIGGFREHVWRRTAATRTLRARRHRACGPAGPSVAATPAGLPPDRIARFAVDADGLRFVVYAVHLPNPLHQTTFAEQREPMEQLLAAIDAETDPVIVAGDLNLSDRSDGYRC